jgi:hypothetical protein
MRTIVAMTLLALPATAAAQPGMTPYYAQPPVAAPAAVEPKLRLELSLGAASPKGDWKDQLAADTSPVFGLQLGFTVAPNISLFGGLRYVSVKLQTNAIDGGVPADLELSHRELQLGLRFMSPLSPSAKFFIEGHVHSATVAASYQGQTDSESGVGLGARGGVVFMVDRKIGLGGAVSYSSADIQIDQTESFDDTWLGVDGFLSFWF